MNQQDKSKKEKQNYVFLLLIAKNKLIKLLYNYYVRKRMLNFLWLMKEKNSENGQDFVNMIQKWKPEKLDLVVVLLLKCYQKDKQHKKF